METVLVTGASAGIGRSLARAFARDGYRLVLVARRTDALRTLARDCGLAADRVHIVGQDLAHPDGAAALCAHLADAGIEIDVVVNDAGFGLRGAVADLPLDRQLAMIQLNVTTVTTLTRTFLPGMLQRGTGGILNVASTAAFQPGPLMSVYYATKAFVLSFTEGVAGEVAGSALRVSCLCPGPTRTEFAERAEMLDTPLFRGAVMDAADVARIGYDGWKAGQVVIVPGRRNRSGTWMVRVAPRSVIRRVVKRLNATA